MLQAEGARAVLIDGAEGQLEIGGTVTGRVPWVPAERVDLLVVLGDDEAIAVREGIALAALRGAGLRAAGAA